ncbi:hypothetical protein EJ04DRAFT_578502 [Polyplosphaeria fusca]|uniref:Uncharacterized protein n=1 Tax=Polyplosphaeria fusca TaxID=682080 RepID=A0A9P4QW57_9PLEO|nr:hypothetical protein EJ04DRAFT_578502 [Polyplosphaeria fusca]
MAERRPSRRASVVIPKDAPSSRSTRIDYKVEIEQLEEAVQTYKSRFELAFTALILLSLYVYVTSGAGSTASPASLASPVYPASPTKFPALFPPEVRDAAPRINFTHIERFHTYLPAPFQHISVAQMGWLLADPWESLNIDSATTNLSLNSNNATEKNEVYTQLYNYARDYLAKPWLVNGEPCNKDHGLYAPNICRHLQNEVEKPLKTILDKKLTKYWSKRKHYGTGNEKEQARIALESSRKDNAKHESARLADLRGEKVN